MMSDPRGPKGIYKKLRLVARVSTRNMYLFDETGAIRKFESPEDIIRHHRDIRLKTYALRKGYLIRKMEQSIEVLRIKERFLELVLNGTIDTKQKSKKHCIQQIYDCGLLPPPPSGGTAGTEEGAEEGSEIEALISPAKLLKISMWDMTTEEIEKFRNQMAKLEAELEQLKQTSCNQMWERELLELKTQMTKFLEESSSAQDEKQLKKLLAKGTTTKGAAKKRAVKKT